MRRRLRKKHQLGEFEPFVMAIMFQFTNEERDSEVNAKWFDVFLDFLAARDLRFTDSGLRKICSGVIETVIWSADPAQLDRHYHDVARFLDQRDVVKGYRLGPIVSLSEYRRRSVEGEFDYVFVEISESDKAELLSIIAAIDAGEEELIPAEVVLREIHASFADERE